MEAGYTMRRVTLKEVRDLCERFHGYGSVGASATYAFGVFEADLCVAAYSWQPPPPGAARSACPEAPEGVLSLSRMVAVPRDDRALNHVSKPLRRQMRREIDRTRWPVLITFSDEGQGHTGYVYKCSGWEKDLQGAAAVLRRFHGTSRLVLLGRPSRWTRVDSRRDNDSSALGAPDLPAR